MKHDICNTCYGSYSHRNIAKCHPSQHYINENLHVLGLCSEYNNLLQQCICCSMLYFQRCTCNIEIIPINVCNKKYKYAFRNIHNILSILKETLGGIYLVYNNVLNVT